MTVRKIDPKSRYGERALLLSSGRGWASEPETLSRVENPSLTAVFRNGVISVREGANSSPLRKDLLAFLDEMLEQGYYAVGYLGYEFFRFLDSDFAPSPVKDGPPFPDAAFMFFEQEGIHEERVKIQTNASKGAPPAASPVPNMSKRDYVEKVNRVRRYIAEGDVYQVNLSQRFEVQFEVDPEQFLFRLYRAQPVPFACCIDFGDFRLISGSMELFLQKRGRQIVTRPIKGTRRRGLDEQEDEALRNELLESAKERAENLMIVDLMRNDLGRVCEFGSVRVNKLFSVEPYLTLFQMVSEVEGRLREDASLDQIIRATFPPGSVTGAPKRRAMEIIDELEPHMRGPYCGAIGFFRPDGDFTLSVAIRVLAASHGKGVFWVGGGIMWDSNPELEYEETLIKAEAMMRALRQVS
jgi:para-aminobenzoate synthetase component 1